MRKEDGSQLHLRQGTWGDRPLLADFDGDNVDDFTVWRPSTGTWYIRRSRDGRTMTRQWGADGDVPVALYDGTMNYDLAVWRPSTGRFYVVRTDTGKSYQVKLGAAGDLPL